MKVQENVLWASGYSPRLTDTLLMGGVWTEWLAEQGSAQGGYGLGQVMRSLLPHNATLW